MEPNILFAKHTVSDEFELNTSHWYHGEVEDWIQFFRALGSTVATEQMNVIM
jgi:hypothetical protein